jgi:predicted RNA-binding Zn-ribbon protein involved in translation (DUF1610 family)
MGALDEQALEVRAASLAGMKVGAQMLQVCENALSDVLQQVLVVCRCVQVCMDCVIVIAIQDSTHAHSCMECVHPFIWRAWR